MSTGKSKSVVSNHVLLGLVLVVLVVEVVRVVRYLRNPPTQGATAIAPTVPASAGTPQDFPETLSYRDRTLVLDMPAHRAPREPTMPVPAELLAPRFLDDRRAMAGYLAAFPESDYHIVDVPAVGRFYIDGAPDLVKKVIDHGQVWEPKIVRIIGQFALPGTAVVDVGAHIGTHTVTMSKAVGETGRVYAFEPQKKLYQELVRNLRLNGSENVVPLRLALGDEPGVIEMDATVAANEGGTAVGKGGDRAELRTLDSFELDHVSFIKIDVEGFEIPVLEGARSTLTRERPVVVVEVQEGESFDIAPAEVRAKMVKTIQLLESMGYYVVRISKRDYLGLPLAASAD